MSWRELSCRTPLLRAKDALGETRVSIGSIQPLAEQAKKVSYHILDIDNLLVRAFDIYGKVVKL